MHWVTKPGTSAAGGWSGSSTRASKELRTIPGVRNFGSHIGQALLMDEVVGIYFGENWISVDPAVDYDETLAQDPGGGRRLPRPLPRRADLPEGADQGGADGLERADRRAHLRPGPGRPPEKADEVKEMLSRGSTASTDEHVELQEDIPQVEVEVDLAAAQRYGLKPGDVRRAAATLDRGRGGRRHLPGRQGVRRERVEHARDARQPDGDIENLPIDTPERRHVRLTDVADVRIEPDSERHRARERLAGASTSSANVDGPRPRLRRRPTSRRGSRTSSSRSEYHAELLGEYAERQAAAAAPDRCSRSPPRSASSCSCRRPSAAGAWRRSPS